MLREAGADSIGIEGGGVCFGRGTGGGDDRGVGGCGKGYWRRGVAGYGAWRKEKEKETARRG